MSGVANERGAHEQGGHEQGGHEQGGHEQGGHEQGGHEQGGHERGGHMSDMRVNEGDRRTDALRASPPMFESRLLDACSRVHPTVPVVAFLPAIVAMATWELSLASVPLTLGLALVGYAVWTLFEYWLHRLVFHFEPRQGIGARLHWIIHGVHHDHPNDPLRLVMPPAVSVPLAVLVFGALELVFGSRHAPGVAAGFYAGYLIYDMIHYYVHHFRPRGWLGRTLRERHMRHHFQDDTRGFGISAPYWDEVFRTSPRSRRAETSR